MNDDQFKKRQGMLTVRESKMWRECGKNEEQATDKG